MIEQSKFAQAFIDEAQAALTELTAAIQANEAELNEPIQATNAAESVAIQEEELDAQTGTFERLFLTPEVFAHCAPHIYAAMLKIKGAQGLDEHTVSVAMSNPDDDIHKDCFEPLMELAAEILGVAYQRMQAELTAFEIARRDIQHNSALSLISSIRHLPTGKKPGRKSSGKKKPS